MTGDLDAADEHGDPSAHYALDDDDAARASKPYVACERTRGAPDSLAGDPAIGIRENRARARLLNRYDTDALRQHNRSAEFAPLRPLVAEADDAAPAVANTSRGAWRAVTNASARAGGGAVGGGYVVAEGCDHLGCAPSWITFAPQPRLEASGVYAVALHVPPFDGEAEKCASRRRRRRRRRREAERAVSRIRKNSRGAEASSSSSPAPLSVRPGARAARRARRSSCATRPPATCSSTCRWRPRVGCRSETSREHHTYTARAAAAVAVAIALHFSLFTHARARAHLPRRAQLRRGAGPRPPRERDARHARRGRPRRPRRRGGLRRGRRGAVDAAERQHGRRLRRPARGELRRGRVPAPRRRGGRGGRRGRRRRRRVRGRARLARVGDDA